MPSEYEMTYIRRGGSGDLDDVESDSPSLLMSPLVSNMVVPDGGTGNDRNDGGSNDSNTQTSSTSSSSSPCLIFPMAGVKLSYVLNEFINIECGGRDSIRGLTTSQIIEQFIKPSTQDRKWSYCDMLHDAGHSSYSPNARVFISHAHQCEFLQEIDALRWHFRDKDVVVWFDLFSINQHKTEWTYEWLSTTFMSAIRRIGHTVVILSPWNDPIPFTRAWCIYEAYCTASTAKSKFEIAMGGVDRGQFLDDVINDTEGSINRMLVTIRAEKSQSANEEDRKRIFSAIQQSRVGFATINSMIFDRYRSWVITVAKDALDSCSTENTNDVPILDDRKNKLMRALGLLHAGQGNFEASRYFINKCVQQRASTLGEHHPDTLTSLNDAAMVALKLGYKKRAFDLSTECLDERTVLFGVNHPLTLESMHMVATVYTEAGYRWKAIQLCEKYQLAVESDLGKDHPKCLQSSKDLAKLYEQTDQLHRAQSLFEDTHVRSKIILGANHPETIDVKNNLALVYMRQGKFLDLNNYLTTVYIKVESS